MASTGRLAFQTDPVEAIEQSTSDVCCAQGNEDGIAAL